MELVLFGLLAVMLVFMVINTRKRNKQMKAEQEEKATKTVPGVKVLLQGGLFGTIVSYNPNDLDEPARVELAPGTVVEVHSQAILRIVEPTEAVDEDAESDEEVDADASVETVEDETQVNVETVEETRARLDGDNK